MPRPNAQIRLTGEELALGLSRVKAAPILPEKGDLLSLAEDLVWVVIGFGVAYVCTWLQYRNTTLALVLWLPRLVGYAFAGLHGGQFLYLGILQLWGILVASFRRFFRIAPRITCPRCGTHNSVRAYIDGHGCSNCHATTATCAGCERGVPFMRVMTAEGCPHCHERAVMAHW